MPDLPISGLPAITVPSSSYLLAAVSASVTSKMTVAQVYTAISASVVSTISSSYATSTSNVLGGVDTYVPVWSGSSQLITSSIVDSGYGSIYVGQAKVKNYSDITIFASTEPRIFLSSSNHDYLALYNSYGQVALQYNPPAGSSNNLIRYTGYDTKTLTLQTNGNDRITVDSSGNLQLNAYTTNGLLKTTGSNGTVVVATPGTDYTPTAYLSAYHTASLLVTAINAPCTMSYSTVDFSQGITISGSYSDKIKVTNGGIYNLQFSAATTKTTGTTATVDIWLRKNGSNLSNTNTVVTLPGGANDFAIPAWNFFVSASAGDYFQLMFASPTTNPYISYSASGSTGVAVAVPSVILTVNRVA